jgi:hypothetical protein
MAAWSKYTSALTSRWGQVASRAKSCPKLHLTYGTTYTEEEALDHIHAAIADTHARIKVATVEVEGPLTGVSNHPWVKFSGMWKDDSTFDDFLAEIEADRRSPDSEHPSE